MTNFTGQDIGRYRIIEPLGQGGMATVYRAYDTHLECEVAVKFIRMDQVTPAEVERTLKRFEREAKEVARLTHPSIVKVTDYGEYKGTPYLVMVYLPGGTLKQLAGEPLPYEQAARLLTPVARALEYAHEKNLIHRDIKPGNILLTDRGQPMVSDFGIAKILGLEGGNTLTSTNVAIGTPEYMAPEQWFNQISTQSDIYSLGVVFYELVTGRKPYTADTPAAIFLKQSTDPLPRPRSFVPGLPEEVERVLYKALAKKPEERYASMGEFTAALEGLSSPDRPARPVQPSQPEVLEKVRMRPETLAATSKPPQQEVFKTAETEPGIPASTPDIRTSEADKGGPQPADSGIIPVSLTLRTASGRPNIRRWVWAVIAVIALVGLVALTRCGVSKYTSGLTVTQTLRALAALPSTATLVPPSLTMLPTPTKPPTSTIPAVPTQSETSLATTTPIPTLIPTLGIGATQVSPKDGMVMVYIPEGEFLMGADKSKDSHAQSDEFPQHTVYLDAFWIDRTEVTNAMYEKCVTAGACIQPYNSRSASRKSYYGNADFIDYPVIYVDWNDAQAYCAWTGRRLPSEAEWEKAARGVDGRIYPWGNTAPDLSKLNYNYPYGDTTAVGGYPSLASPYGALDMAGNVYEWVNDWYSSRYYQQSPSRNPVGPALGSERVTRSGFYWANGNVAMAVRSTQRVPSIPQGSDIIGFRCSASP